jgi:hypothetical protein
LPACDVEGSKLLLSALGDFDSPRTTSVDLKGSGDIDLPPELLGIEASTSPPGLRGIGYAEPPEDVHLTLWSAASACDATADFPVPESRGGQAMTAFDGGGSVIIAGLDPVALADVSKSAFAWAWDARIGQTLPLSNRSHRITLATATPFGKGALIAGGLDRKFFPGYLATALVYRDGDIQEPPITIGDARADHGAVVLANGATLLVGGEDDRGVVDTLVSITPSEVPPYGTADLFMLGSLARARKRPFVMRLSTDEILVAGGVDGTGRYVSTLEWFSKEGRPCARHACTIDPPELAPIDDLAFVTLTGGGALAVGGITRDTGAPSHDVFWIANDGAVVETLAPLTPQQRGTKKLRLVAAGDGAPWLWNGTAWFRFDPWLDSFSTPDAAPEDGPDEDMPAPVAVDPGLFVWLARLTPGDISQPATLRGFRYGVRGPYTIDPDFVLADPRHMAPSRPPAVGGEIWAHTDGLHLTEFASAVITDTTYGDVAISGEVPGSALPALMFGDWALGKDGCPWPGVGTKFTVTRTGRTLAMSVEDEDSSASGSCTGPQDRTTLGLRGLGPETVTVKSLAVRRR